LTTLFLSSSFELGKIPNLVTSLARFQKAKFTTSLISKNYANNLSLVLKNKYNIETIVRINNNSRLYGGSLYIKNSSFFSKLVKPHISYSQYYLLNKPTLKLNLFGTHRLQNSSISYLLKRDFSTKKDLSDVKYTLKYKKEYELSLVQKEAIVGIIGPKFYSTLGISSSNKYPIDILNPKFLTGFTDALRGVLE
jgi:hypothetical protein